MMRKVVTESAGYFFAVKERQDGTSFIMLEPRSQGLPAIGDGMLTLQFRGDVSTRQAEELAQQLNDLVERVSHTRFEVDPGGD